MILIFVNLLLNFIRSVILENDIFKCLILAIVKHRISNQVSKSALMYYCLKVLYNIIPVTTFLLTF